jgi:hypothetical protein
MKKLISLSAIEGGFIWETEATHGTKYAFAKTVQEAVAVSNRLLGGVEPATPPVVLESPEISLYRMGNGFAIMKHAVDSMNMEIVGVLPTSYDIEQIANAMAQVMEGEQLEIEHRHVHAKKAKSEGNVVQFPSPASAPSEHDAIDTPEPPVN